jgi:hypothetical protein
MCAGGGARCQLKLNYVNHSCSSGKLSAYIQTLQFPADPPVVTSRHVKRPRTRSSAVIQVFHTSVRSGDVRGKPPTQSIAALSESDVMSGVRIPRPDIPQQATSREMNNWIQCWSSAVELTGGKGDDPFVVFCWAADQFTICSTMAELIHYFGSYGEPLASLKLSNM